MATEPIDGTHQPTLLRRAPGRAVPRGSVQTQDSPEPPSKDRPLLVMLFDESEPGQVTYGSGWPSGPHHATVTVTGMELRVDLETGAVARPRAARRRLDRWVTTRWRIVCWWTVFTALGEDVPHAR